ncbi:MAG: NYN domain-containing protein [Spirulina sp. SIO3F2]|nr:NYN domain-containing protein [Spirulina sp. SIO3F2]
MIAPAFIALLLVDGYNMIGAWPELKGLQHQEGLASARDRLLELLINYAASQGYRTRIVFDAYTRRDRASEEQHTEHVSTYYTDFGQTADAYIEKSCAQFYRREDTPRLIVATSDRAQQQTVLGYGAEWLSAQQLQIRVQQTHRQRQKRQRPAQASSGRFLFQGLDPQAQARLNQLRQGRF